MSVQAKAPRRILVTGASGYIGRAALGNLIAMGHEVHALGRSDPGVAGVAFHQSDLLATAAPPDLAGIGADTLLHCAWSVSPGRFWIDPANVDWVAASIVLFRAFVQAGGRRIVGVGSCAEYAWTHSPLDEATTPVAPATLYGTAKASLGGLLAAYGREAGIETAWGRLFFLYGPGEPSGKLVADATIRLLAGQTMPTTSGTQRRDFLHVDDAGRALAMLTASVLCGPVNIASGECVPVRKLLETIEALTGAEGLIDYGARPLAASEPAELAAGIARLRDEVGFVPRFSLADGLADAVAWWRARLATAGQGSQPA